MPFSGNLISLRGLLGLAILFSLGRGSVGYAQSANESEKQCGDYGTQVEMNECAAMQAHKADEALNSTYRTLLSRLKGDKTATARVVAAEKAWITFRDAELAADWPIANGENPNLLYGSVHPFCYYNELARLTLERLKTLSDRMRHEEEGDVCSTAIASMGSRHDSTHSCSAATAEQKSLHVHRHLDPGVSGE
jgi:uncharacterized protein YecT (DUF1311 family)